ncbi:ATP-dependent DNA ligase [Agrobacterium tumefaciens]|uniref:ATP dependent DNA ligase n=1 Tax=Agrobacterium TaxID=357 RepID=UPI000FD6FCED|nr:MULTISPECIES: ATP-dependent DNA ligase [Agrobacterium]RVT73871.1 ATP-dependent DNA ligase [Agrobacterium sp. CNPSo 2736]UXT21039.1 ATP-dependent DNA ligase [Agrobacterium tumefaciens]
MVAFVDYAKDKSSSFGLTVGVNPADWSIRGDEIVYADSVGTGCREAQATNLRVTLDRLKRKRSPLACNGSRKDIVWALPTIITEIHCRGWTHQGKLRHASFKGARDVQDNADVFRIEDVL